MSYNLDSDYEKYGEFVSLQHLGEQFGIEYEKLVERLNKGSSLYMALSVPGEYDMEVKQYSKRGTHYTIRQTVFRGSEKDLVKWLGKGAVTHSGLEGRKNQNRRKAATADPDE